MISTLPLRTLSQRLRPWRMKLALGWNLHLGRPAAIGLVLLALVVIVQVVLVPTLHHEQAQIAARQMRLTLKPLPGQAATPAAVREPLAINELPTSRQRGQDLEQLVAAVERQNLTLERADYSAGAVAADGVMRVEATLPLTGSYGGVRRLVAAVLNEMPHAGLESLQIERPNAQSTQVQATARFVFFYRREAP